MSALYRLTVTETKLFFREPIVVFFALAFSPILLVVLGLIPGMREPIAALGDLTPIAVYTPVIVAMGVALFSLSGLAPLFATYRDKGILRRLRTTPVRPVTMLGAQLLMAGILSVATTALILTIGWLAFDIDPPRNVIGYLAGFFWLAAALFAIGLLIAALAPSATSASAVGTLVFFPLAFFAGLWLPRADMNGILLTISDFTPLGAGVQALHDATLGQWPQLLHLAVMVAWATIAGGFAVRYFLWE